MTEHLLLIDDDERLARMVGEYLQSFHFTVTHAPTGAAGLSLLEQTPFDLVLLDLMLPDTDGLIVCKQIRALGQNIRSIPIVMLTAKGDPIDRVLGLELGADDYVPKPFEPRELLARIRAVLRRRHSATQGQAESLHVLQFGRLTINAETRQASVSGVVCDLTSYQFNLLLVLAQRAGRVLTREQIMEAARGRELDAFDRSIDVHIGRIRQAIEIDIKNPQRILTVRGIGYVFAKQQT